MALGDELVAGALGFARAPLQGLDDAALADAPSFAHAAGVDGFVDAGGAVAGHLTAARTALGNVAPALAAANVLGAATQLGTAIRELDLAATAIPGGHSLMQLL